MLRLARYPFLCLALPIWVALGSDITTFTDEKCRTSFDNLEVVNGYPDGPCKPLNISRNLQTFQIAGLDPGCAVTLYGPNDDTNLACSSSLKIVGELATCYNSSWIYYSVDGCLDPKSSSVVLPTAVSTTSSSVSSFASTSTSSSSPTTEPTTPAAATPASTTPTEPPTPNAHSISTGLIVGSIVGSVVFCALVIGLLLLCLRRRDASSKLESMRAIELSHDRHILEAPRGSVTQPISIPQKGVWGHESAVEIGRNSYSPPVELPAQSLTSDKKRLTRLMHVHMAR